MRVFEKSSEVQQPIRRFHGDGGDRVIESPLLGTRSVAEVLVYGDAFVRHRVAVPYWEYGARQLQHLDLRVTTHTDFPANNLYLFDKICAKVLKP